MLKPTNDESSRRDFVRSAILMAIRNDVTIKLPNFDKNLSKSSPENALLTVGLEPNLFGGTVGPYRYQFEGEEDLLHLIVTRIDIGEISVEEAQDVAEFLLSPVAPALIWLKPGERSQHFYVGHDELRVWPKTG